jgi:heme oxygenase
MEMVATAVEQAAAPHLAAVWLDPLRRDLEGLRLDLVDLAAPRAQQDAASGLGITAPAEAWGALYVMEGARLGGRVIAKRIAAACGISAAFGGRYLHDEEEPTAVRWRRFLERLEDALDDVGRRERALVATRRTFALFF